MAPDRAFGAAVRFDERQGQSCDGIGGSQAAARIAMRKTRQKAASHSEQAAEVVAGGGEDGVGGVAVGPGEIVSTHAMLGLGVSDSTAERRRSSRLMVSVMRRL